ncbi:MFS general substrate transporter [Stereum hirsutum FP-91666 SS1]|uniref:MFS general substrate transporter n=1 Tax=Stereum hirsutum (strain FP-91666) TaxID=721885 RepID=UPI000444A5DE|nr:MFS general substrate transporter [Stereum hirsutum FP-91666 SS1]EIM85985.1 MFS general substrate transporter [Stereum hirsutum FP-91666 SS1]
MEPEDDPQQLSSLRRWLSVFTISLASTCVTCASSAASFTEKGVASEFHVSQEVTILSISLFVLGLGLGPLVVGPLSEVYGRNIIYRISFLGFFAFTWPIAFAPNIAVYLIFRFVTGLFGAAFLSVAGGSISDLFPSNKVATPMSLYTLTPFMGPEIGPLFSGFINQNTDWRWTYYVFLIWSFLQTVALFTIIPETFGPVILKHKAQRLRKTTGDLNYYAPIERTNKSLLHALTVSCYTPFQLIIYDRMALLLNLWTALILGIIYLTFQAFPIVFETGHGFNTQTTGLTFLGLALGLFLGLSTQPYWNGRSRKYREAHGNYPPEEILRIGQIGGILVPIGLFWLAFTTYPHVHWIVPIIASVPFGMGTYFIFTSVFTYLVVAYRPIAASAMASNSFMRSCFAAGFPLFATAMYHRLGTVGATALLAGLTTVMAPLPFIFYRIGGRLRHNSRFGTKNI